MITCTCPGAASLPFITNVRCGESFGQIQKVAFQRLMDDTTMQRNGWLYTGSSGDGQIEELASWAPFLAANDSTRIVISPYIQAPTSEGGAPRTFGGGNETLGGIEEIIGREPTPFSGVLRRMPQSVIKQLKELQCESWSDNLGVYLFDENGAIECLAVVDDNQQLHYYPIPIRSLFIGDKTHGGLEAPDSNVIQWSFLPNFSDDLAIITPNFNPLTDLENYPPQPTKPTPGPNPI